MPGMNPETAVQYKLDKAEDRVLRALETQNSNLDDTEDIETAVQDLVTDIQLFCIKNDIVFEQLEARARAHAEHESTPSEELLGEVLADL